MPLQAGKQLILSVLVVLIPAGYFGACYLHQLMLPLDKPPFVHWSGLDPHHEVFVTWESSRETPSFLCYGTEPDHFEHILQENAAVTLHRFHLKDLSPDTRYYYRAGPPPTPASDELSETRSFKTASETPEEFSIACVSDTQEMLGIGYYNTLASTIAKGPDMAFVVNAGDLTQVADDQHLWNLFFRESTFLARFPLAPCPGNHDDIDIPNPLYFKYFGVTANDRDVYYAFDWGDARFIVAQIANIPHLDTAAPRNQAAYRWLEETLAASQDRDYRILIFHRDAADVVAPLVEKYNVSLSMHGHVHSYARYMIHQHTYVCLGNGATVQDAFIWKKAEVQKVTNHAGFMKLTINPSGIRLQTFTPRMDVMDEVFLRRDATTGAVVPEDPTAVHRGA